MPRELKIRTNGPVTYKFSPFGRTWEFEFPTPKGESKTGKLFQVCKGANIARKVAKLIDGAIKRKGMLDNVARSHIARVVETPVAN